MDLKPQHRIVLIYLLLGGLWIYFSDRVVNAAFETPAQLAFAQSAKGWAYVAVTGLLLYLLIRRAVNTLEETHQALLASYDQTIDGWVQVMDIRHNETRNHTARVTSMTVELARLAGMEGKALLQVKRGAMLHDIGKLGVPDHVLLKPGKLDEAEWVLMKQHPTIAFELMNAIEFLRPCVDIPYCHHEKWDGSGYPRGLKGDAIPLATRIFSIIDVWDALSFVRVYKAAWPESEVVNYIRSQSGQHFDPRLVDLFFRNYEQVKAAGAATPCAVNESPAHRPERLPGMLVSAAQSKPEAAA